MLFWNEHLWFVRNQTFQMTNYAVNFRDSIYMNVVYFVNRLKSYSAIQWLFHDRTIKCIVFKLFVTVCHFLLFHFIMWMFVCVDKIQCKYIQVWCGSENSKLNLQQLCANQTKKRNKRKEQTKRSPFRKTNTAYILWRVLFYTEKIHIFILLWCSWAIKLYKIYTIYKHCVRIGIDVKPHTYTHVQQHSQCFCPNWNTN